MYSVRSPSDLDTLLLLSTSSNTPLITLWTAVWCSSCKAVSPLLKSLIEEDNHYNNNGSALASSSSNDRHVSGALGYVEIDLSSPFIGDVPVTYGISSIPTLLAFSRGEAQHETKVHRIDDLKSREFLRSWLEEERKRGGRSGAGGGWFR